AGIRIGSAPIVGKHKGILYRSINPCGFHKFVGPIYCISQSDIPDGKVRSISNETAVDPVTLNTGDVTSTYSGTKHAVAWIFRVPKPVFITFHQVEHTVQVGCTVKVPHQ